MSENKSFKNCFTMFLTQNGWGEGVGGCQISSKGRVKPWFFMTFNIIISYIFPEKFIEIPQVVQKI